ncbi:serine hydrolase domain-containing protein [Paenibacillus macquariensis]|nr:serine hydrolase domain-containing protein [Paenibacillus macquariensis]MEC0088986.1 serine hydrolase [Paenibacillus macquariensis]OAB31873.1 hypothetical protein PMSM_18760 [Paenibacillus macquariensis subsp. macquariensis]
MLLYCLLPTSNAYGSTTLLPETAHTIDKEIEENMTRFNIPGMAFVLADENGNAYVKGYGRSEWGSTERVDPTTNFHIGSISKVFTSLAIMQLRDQGLVKLDAPVTQYLPWFATKDISLSSRITIKDLLNHTSGLPSRLNTHDVEGSDPDHIASQIERKLHNVQLVATPGTTYEYTNMNYDLLQLLLEKVTKQSFPEYMSQHVFKPLGMTRTVYALGDILPNSATGHRYIWGNIQPFHEQLSYATLGSAGLTTNAEDFGKYISFLLGRSSEGNSSVLRSETLLEMHTPAIYDQSTGFGFGWEVSPNTIEKKGGLPGFTANLIIFPNRSYGFALLSNTKQDITDHTNFNISRILEGNSPTYLSKQNFPAITPINKGILMVSTLFTIMILLMWLPNFRSWLNKKSRYSFQRPTLPTILVCWVLNGLLLIGVSYYIYSYIPYASGTPHFIN